MTKQLFIVNKTTCLSNEQINKYIRAVQKQVDHDFYPIWGQKCVISLTEENLIDRSNSWVFYFLDYPPDSLHLPEGVLGFHEQHDGVPDGYIFAKTDLDNGLDPCVTFSHEVLELLADVYTTWCALVEVNGVTPMLYSIEVCDAVEDDGDGYMIDDCRVSNFLYPEWFNPTSRNVKYDHRGLCKAPLEIRPGGYMPVFDFKDTQWKQIAGPESKRFTVKSTTRSSFTRMAKRNKLIKLQKSSQ